jgi:molybdate transport repressor ModE-like protein
MTGNKTRRSPQLAVLQPRVKVWLEKDGGSGFCQGMCRILQAIEETGSIKHAAAEMGKSYRHIWGRIKAAEKLLDKQLVETHIGGKHSQRSVLTPDARDFVQEFLAMGDRISQVLEEEFTRRFR